MILVSGLKEQMKLTFRQWFKVVCDRADISQSQIAAELDLSKQTVGNWLGGRSKPALDPSQTRKLCQLLGVSLDELATAFEGGMEVSGDD